MVQKVAGSNRLLATQRLGNFMNPAVSVYRLLRKGYGCER